MILHLLLCISIPCDLCASLKTSQQLCCQPLNFYYLSLQSMGPSSLMFVRNLLEKLTSNQQNILKFIACNEIFLMPATVFMLFRYSLITVKSCLLSGDIADPLSTYTLTKHFNRNTILILVRASLRKTISISVASIPQDVGNLTVRFWSTLT